MESIQPVLPYKPPQRTEAAYARQAVDVLKVAEHLDVRLLAYLLAPSNVLTLAGLRSFSPYNDALPADIDISKFARLLQSCGFLWIDEQPNIVNPPLASFALINLEAVDGFA